MSHESTQQHGKPDRFFSYSAHLGRWRTSRLYALLADQINQLLNLHLGLCSSKTWSSVKGSWTAAFWASKISVPRWMNAAWVRLPLTVHVIHVTCIGSTHEIVLRGESCSLLTNHRQGSPDFGGSPEPGSKQLPWADHKLVCKHIQIYKRKILLI